MSAEPTKPIATAPEERPHHAFSPSQLQSLEACPCYLGRSDSINERAIAGTLAHKVTETGEDDENLSDFDAAAAGACMDFYLERLDAVKKMREDDHQRLLAARVPVTDMSLPPIEELKEIYLPIDETVYHDFVPTDDGGIRPVSTKHTTAGYIDRAIIYRNYAEILDWKFGFWQVEKAENNLQCIGYSLGIFKKFPKVESVRCWFKQPHIGYLTDHTFHRSDIAKLYLRVQVVVARARTARNSITLNGSFGAATPIVPACNFCAHIALCPAVAKFVLKVGQKFSPIDVPENITPSMVHEPKDISMALRLAGVVATWAKSYKSRLTEMVMGDQVPMPEGWSLQTKSGRRTMKDDKKFIELAKQAGISDEEIAEASSVAMSKIEEFIHKKAPRGSKGPAVEAFQELAASTGAVEPGKPYAFLRQKTTSE